MFCGRSGILDCLGTNKRRFLFSIAAVVDVAWLFVLILWILDAEVRVGESVVQFQIEIRVFLKKLWITADFAGPSIRFVTCGQFSTRHRTKILAKMERKRITRRWMRNLNHRARSFVDPSHSENT